ncbi:MAG TPA: hypothetical protein VMC09_12315 [Anaerolineales bacterium]|nr:hypothetical protein [Anaerolineales bacterium]
MSRTLSIVIIVGSVLLALALLGGLVWANTVYIRAHPLEKDFLVPWLAARTFIQYGQSPYSDPATQRAQIQYYGRLAQPGEDPLALWLPFPVELFYFPFALITNYAIARGLWLALLELALLALAYLSLQLTSWKPPVTFLPFLGLFSVFGVFGLLSSSSSSGLGFLALALGGFLLALHEERDELAGALLFVALFEPRFTGVFFVLVFWWIIFQRRMRVIWGFLMGLVFLLVLSFFLLPDWFLPFLRGLFSHAAYFHGRSLFDILAGWSPVIGPRLGWAILVVVALVLFVEWGIVLQRDFRHFMWIVSVTLVATPFLGIPINIKDYVFLFIPLVLFLSILAERFSRPRRWGAAEFTFLGVALGLWLLTVLLVGINALGAWTDVMFLGLPGLLLIGLYWMRWWFVRPVRTELGLSE